MFQFSKNCEQCENTFSIHKRLPLIEQAFSKSGIVNFIHPHFGTRDVIDRGRMQDSSFQVFFLSN